jgi:hypothetical protein
VNKSSKMHAIIGLLLAYSFVTSAASTAIGQTNICRNTNVAFVFFNGIWTTASEADLALFEFRKLHGEMTSRGEGIRYEKLYNYTNGFEDIVETFEQRLQEQGRLIEGRFELFSEALDGDGPWWSKIINSVSSTAAILDGFVNWYQARLIQSLTELAANPPTTVNYSEHRVRIDNLILEGNKLLFVAHSQGNLFANAAYNYARTKVSSESVNLVHIAPASPILNGNHTLGDIDLVINALRLVGSVASVTDFMPGYLLRPPGANGQTDIKGHGLLPIYMLPLIHWLPRLYKPHLVSLQQH